MTTVLLALLFACSASLEDQARAALEADGMTDIELTGDVGIYEFRANKGEDMCAGTIHAQVVSEPPKIEAYCSPAWGAEQLELPVAVSKQGRDRASACDKGDQKSCALLGTDYRDGTNGIPGDKEDAIRLFTSACEGGAYQGCTYLADGYDEGTLVERNDDKAQELYTKACELGSEVSCKRLGKTAPGADDPGEADAAPEAETHSEGPKPMPPPVPPG